MRLKMLAVLTALAVAGIAAPAAASQDIPWTWNSEDQDARARFQAEGEVFYGQGYEPDSYVDWQGPSGSGRWNLGEDGLLEDLNFDWPEDRAVGLNVCQQHNLYPDDCSGWRAGRS